MGNCPHQQWSTKNLQRYRSSEANEIMARSFWAVNGGAFCYRCFNPSIKPPIAVHASGAEISRPHSIIMFTLGLALGELIALVYDQSPVSISDCYNSPRFARFSFSFLQLTHRVVSGKIFKRAGSIGLPHFSQTP